MLLGFATLLRHAIQIKRFNRRGREWFHSSRDFLKVVNTPWFWVDHDCIFFCSQLWENCNFVAWTSKNWHQHRSFVAVAFVFEVMLRVSDSNARYELLYAETKEDLEIPIKCNANNTTVFRFSAYVFVWNQSASIAYQIQQNQTQICCFLPDAELLLMPSDYVAALTNKQSKHRFWNSQS